MKVVVAGISDGPFCGVHDHAEVLSNALREAGLSVTTAWSHAAPGATRTRRFGHELRRRCQEVRPAAVLLHYSVFSFSYRGVPAGVPALAARLRRLGIPVVLFAHEFAYPWGRRGWRGAIHAVTQRVALIPLFSASAVVVVTTPERVRWLRTRGWLAGRPVLLTPVFSNIMPPKLGNPPATEPGRIGLFGFGAEGQAIDLVVGAVADVAHRSTAAHLMLIGSPGPDSPAAEQWKFAARAANCPLTFTGAADSAEVSRQLRSCQLIVFADPAGPTSRKTSLAAALAHGQVVVALDGPQRWGDLVEAGAVVVVDSTRAALAARLDDLLAHATDRAVIAERALSFAEQHLDPRRAAATVLRAIDSAVSAGDGRLVTPAQRPQKLR